LLAEVAVVTELVLLSLLAEGLAGFFKDQLL
jgi:hypothetical protein